MKYLKTVLMVSSIALFTACGSSSSSDGGSTPIDYSGNYDITVHSTTNHDKFGGPCGDAGGIININTDYLVSGKVSSEWGDVFNLSGEVL